MRDHGDEAERERGGKDKRERRHMTSNKMSSEQNKMSDKSDRSDEIYERYMDIHPVVVSILKYIFYIYQTTRC